MSTPMTSFARYDFLFNSSRVVDEFSVQIAGDSVQQYCISSAGAIQLQASSIGGNAPVLLNWFDENNDVIGTGLSITLQYTAASDNLIKVEATDSNGNTVVDFVKIVVLPNAADDLIYTYNYCTEHLLATVQGGSSFLWSNGATSSSVNFTSLPNLQNGEWSFSVQVSAPDACPVTLSQSGLSDQFTKISGPSAICEGLSATIRAFGGSAYLWSTGETTSSISVADDRTYKVTITYPGCALQLEHDLAILDKPEGSIYNANGALACNGGDMRLLGFNQSGGSNLTFEWSTGESTPTIQINKEGTYTLIATTQEGCKEYFNFKYNTHPFTSAVFSGSPHMCNEEDATISISNLSNVVWTSPEGTITTGNTLLATSPGLYTYSGVDNNGCASNGNKEIIYGSDISLYIVGGGSVNKCEGNPHRLTAVAEDPISQSWTYQWNVPNSNDKEVYVSQSGTFIVTVTNEYGCVAAATVYTSFIEYADVQIEVNPVPVNGAYTITASGAESYVWSTGETTPAINYTPSTNGLFPYVIGSSASKCKDVVYAEF
jgi:hypothetical protein